MSRRHEIVVYWDSSAILSALFADARSAEALSWIARSGVHLLSTLAWAKVHAVIARIKRERAAADVLVNAARETLADGPWRRVNLSPAWHFVQELSSRWSLRGADLWHLALVRTLQVELPEILLLSFNERLAQAAAKAGLDRN